MAGRVFKASEVNDIGDGKTEILTSLKKLGAEEIQRGDLCHCNIVSLIKGALRGEEKRELRDSSSTRNKTNHVGHSDDSVARYLLMK